jgi:FkbM family methyltransferase
LPLTAFVKRGVRSLLVARGYYLRQYAFLPYGVDWIHDVKRLSNGEPIQYLFDVGAHRGETVVQALAMLPDARVIAFEPHPKTFQVLSNRFASSPRVTLHNVALDQEKHIGWLYEYELSNINSLASDARFAAEFRSPVGQVEVNCISLDQFCAQSATRAIDVLKIDTEGYELNVLQGARQFLSEGRIRFIYLEFNDMCEEAGRTGGALIPIAEFLHQFGYKFIATYTDAIETEGKFFVVANALFALCREQSSRSSPAGSNAI